MQNTQIIVESIKPLFPKPAIFLQPAVGFLERPRIDFARPHLCIPAARNQTCTLEHLEMLGDGRQAHFERLGEFQHRGLAEREPRQNGAPGRIGERRKG